MTERTEAIWNRCLASGCGLLSVAMLPLLFSRVLVAAGVQWSRVNDGDRLNALIGLGVGGIGLAMTGIGIFIAVLAYRLTAQGTVLAQKRNSGHSARRSA